MAGIWNTHHNYEGYSTNMVKKKGLQPVYPSSNDLESRNLDNNNKNGKAQHNIGRNMLNITYKDRKTNKWVSK